MGGRFLFFRSVARGVSVFSVAGGGKGLVPGFFSSLHVPSLFAWLSCRLARPKGERAAFHSTEARFCVIAFISQPLT